MSIFIQNFADRVAFQPERFNPIVLVENEHTKVILACFEPGQFIPVHRPGVDLTLVVLEGEGRIVAGGNEQHVGPGAVVFAPAGEERGVKAETRLVVLHVVTPPPTDEDHIQVKAGLQQDRWR